MRPTTILRAYGKAQRRFAIIDYALQERERLGARTEELEKRWFKRARQADAFYEWLHRYLLNAEWEKRA
jgi:hypothetical protein